MINLTYLQESFDNLDDNWQKILTSKNLVKKLQKIDDNLCKIACNNIIYPSKENVFNALRLTKFDDIRVVIVGQDPYHGENEANGLAFAVNDKIRLPPSLKNILLELSREYAISVDNLCDGLLQAWSKQGVLLLNSSLTVIKDKPNSLINIGWDIITDAVIRYIGENKTNIVFMLWGNFARNKAKLLDVGEHKILESSHPSPLSVYRGFNGCNHFILANEYLIQCGKPPINWCNA